MKYARRLLTVVMSGALLSAAAPARAVVNEYQTLELVRTYPSEADFQAANANMLRAKHPIVDDGQTISFIDPDTGNVLKQITREQTIDEIYALSAEEQAQIVEGNSITKPYVDYMLPNLGYPTVLVANEVEINIHRPDERGAGSDWKYVKQSVYNRNGEKIVELPPDANQVVGAPNGDSFLAYFDNLEESPGEFMYFYNVTGQLLNKLHFPHAMLNVRYSWNSEYLALYNLMSTSFSVVTCNGEMVLQADMRDYLSDDTQQDHKFGNLEGIQVSDDGQYIFLSTSWKVFLLNRQGQKLWEMPVQSPFAPVRAYFDITRGRVYLSRIEPEISYENRGHSLDSLKIWGVDLAKGIVLDEIPEVSYYTIINDHLYLKKLNGGYYDYQFKE